MSTFTKSVAVYWIIQTTDVTDQSLTASYLSRAFYNSITDICRHVASLQMPELVPNKKSSGNFSAEWGSDLAVHNFEKVHCAVCNVIK